MADEPITEADTSSGGTDPHAETFDGETADSAWLDSKVGARGDEWVGSFIGQFEIVRVIGTGGMGNVYEARQTNPHRSVALKIVKSAAASKTTLQRFEMESEMLARLQHPGIAQVYESGHHPHDGKPLPFFAMEFVPGSRSITDYADDEQMELKERLELFLQVCEAVQYGHGRGVIHRDLKPSNILISVSGRPKVIDFGVALMAGDEASDSSITVEGRFVGTLQWSSPEQCGEDPHDVDVRTDVYSLGVVLYQLLLQQLPYNLKGVPLFRAPEVIRDTPPEKPRSINKHIAIELEFITLKSLSKNREDRYESVAELAADLKRYLSDEPILAKPPSIASIIRLYARRNKLKFQAGLIVIAAMLLGIGGLLWGYIEAQSGQETLKRALKIKDDTLLFAEQNAYAARLRTAQVAMSGDSWSMASEQLALTDDDQRGWEWGYLNSETDQSVFQWTIGDAPTSIAVFNTGDSAVVAAADGRVIVLDFKSKSPTNIYMPNKVQVILVSHDDKEIILGTTEGELAVVDIAENTILTKEIDLSAFQALVKLQDGRMLSGHADGTVILWSSDNEILRTVADLDSLVSNISWNESLQLATVGLADGNVYAFSLTEQKPLLVGTQRANVSGMVFIDDQTLATSGGDTVKLWDIQAGKLVGSFTPTQGEPMDLEVVGDLLVIAHENGVVTTRSLVDYQLVDTLRGHKGIVWDLAKIDENSVVSVGKDGQILTWEIGEPPVSSIQVQSGLPASDVVFVDREHIAILSHVSSNLQIANVTTGESRTISTPSYQKLTVVDVVRAKNKVVTGDLSGTIRAWDVAENAPLEAIGSLDSEIISLDVSQDGTLVAAGSLDGSIGVWNLQTSQRVLKESVIGNLILDLAISFDNSKLFISASSNKFFAIDLRTGKIIWSTVGVGADIIAIDLVHRLGKVITTTQQGMTRLIEGETGKVLAISGSLGSLPRDLVVLPYGNRALMTSRDGAVHVWNIDNLGKIVSLPVTSELDGIAVSLDGTRVAVCGGSSVVHILDSFSRGRRLKELRK